MSTAILLPGSASTGEFVHRAFAEVLDGVDVLHWSPRGGNAVEIAAQLRQVVAECEAGPLVIIGVSIGAHAAAFWASSTRRTDTRLLLALPAWTGAASQVAAMTGVAAQRIAGHGLARELQTLSEAFGDDWVVNELVRAWGAADRDTLVATLRETAGSPAPTPDQLGRITMPTLVLGLFDDPMHPWSVAREWAAAIPAAQLVGLHRDDPQSDISIFGRASAATPWAHGARQRDP